MSRWNPRTWPWNPRTWAWRRHVRNVLIIGLVCFSLLLITHLVLTILARRELDRERALCVAAGMPMDLATMTLPDLPNRDNAALDYAEAYRLLTADGEKPWTTIETSCTGISGIKELWELQQSHQVDHRVWNEVEVALIQSTLARYEPALAIIERGSRKPFCRHPFPYRKGPETLLPHITLNKSIVIMLELRAGLAIQAGDLPAAMRDVSIMLRFGEHQKQDRFLISFLVGRSLRTRALGVLQQIVARAGNPDLDGSDLFTPIAPEQLNAQLVDLADFDRIMSGGWTFDLLNRSFDFSSAEQLSQIVGFRPWVLWMYSQVAKPLSLHDEAVHLAISRELRTRLATGSPLDVSALVPGRLAPVSKMLCLDFALIAGNVARDQQHELLARAALAVAAYRHRTGSFPADPVAEGLTPAGIIWTAGKDGMSLTTETPATTGKPDPLLRWVVGIDPAQLP